MQLVTNSDNRTFESLAEQHAQFMALQETVANRNAATLLGDMIMPFANRPLRECLTNGTSYKGTSSDGADGKPFTSVFPWFERGTITPVRWSMQNAIPQMAADRYSRLEPGLHVRMFDPASPYETLVQAQVVAGQWVAFDCVGGVMRPHNWGSNVKGAAAFSDKHTAINQVAMAFVAERRIDIVHFRAEWAEEWHDKVTAYLDQPVSKYIEDLGKRWQFAQDLDKASRTTPQYSGNPILIGTIDVSNITARTRVRIEDEESGFTLVLKPESDPEFSAPGREGQLHAIETSIKAGKKVTILA